MASTNIYPTYEGALYRNNAKKMGWYDTLSRMFEFTLPALGAGETVDSAYLYAYGKEYSATQTLSSWVEYYTSWSPASTFATMNGIAWEGPYQSLDVTQANVWYNWDITDGVKNAYVEGSLCNVRLYDAAVTGAVDLFTGVDFSTAFNMVMGVAYYDGQANKYPITLYGGTGTGSPDANSPYLKINTISSSVAFRNSLSTISRIGSRQPWS